ncbi:hypothetical protein [Amycolatopsis pithecellobii]|uniref:Uncharacterized protein n=1 Tax=Amycolatopsis pithecellobii TaxID=664692 RepID=A0A6N7Z503_9PSEU|nr:hypothetical protein [Amycolatopsis pithecellobii]MTD56589.1 hypothetical protein [Amycolatopsis pithecellobii]
MKIIDRPSVTAGREPKPTNRTAGNTDHGIDPDLEISELQHIQAVMARFRRNHGPELTLDEIREISTVMTAVRILMRRYTHALPAAI